MSTSAAGKSAPRRDLLPKLTGEAKYTADLDLPGLLHAAVLRSPHPHADILSVDTAGVRGLPGVHAVLTPFDAPKGMVDTDLPVLDTRVRFVGDEVAAVAAEDRETAREAAAMLRVQYRALPFVLEAEDALREGAPTIHPGGNLVGGEPLVLERGDVREGFEESDLTVEGEYFVPVHSATPLEPRAATASWDGDNLTVWKSSRGVHVDRAALAEALDLDPERVRVVGPYLGGGFGNKDESRVAALAALLAGRARRPVRLEYSREEEFVAGRTRHAAHVRMRVGVKRDGTITAIDTRASINTGAYVASGLGVARRLGQGPLYLYRCPNARYEAHLAYTNRPVAGSYRALGAPQGHFALECLMDRVAEKLGMDPLEFRTRNHVRAEGQPGRRTTPADRIVDSQPVEGGIPFSSNGLDQCLRIGAEAFDWAGRQARRKSGGASVKRGFGVSMMLYRGGAGFHAAAEVRLQRSGRIQLATGLIDVGEGLTTVLCQLAAEALGARYEDIEPILADTSGTPNSPITAGSTATFSTGTAVVGAASRAKRTLLELASLGMESPVEDLDAAQGYIFVKGDPQRRMSMEEAAGLMEGETIVIDEVLTPGSTELHSQLLRRPLRRGGGGHGHGPCPRRQVRGGPRLRSNPEPQAGPEPSRGRRLPDVGLCPDRRAGYRRAYGRNPQRQLSGAQEPHGAGLSRHPRHLRRRHGPRGSHGRQGAGRASLCRRRACHRQCHIRRHRGKVHPPALYPRPGAPSHPSLGGPEQPL